MLTSRCGRMLVLSLWMGALVGVGGVPTQTARAQDGAVAGGDKSAAAKEKAPAKPDSPAETRAAQDAADASRTMLGTYVGERVQRRDAYAKTEGARAPMAAVRRALDWLAIHQTNEGGWDADEFELQCRLNKCADPAMSISDVGVSGAALLAFLGAGETQATGRYRSAVKRGLRYLTAQQDAEGCLSRRDAATFLHDHMWATLAVTEAYALTGSQRWKAHAQRAVDFVLAAENPYLGWGHGVRRGDNTTTMTALAMAVLRAAEDAGLFDDAVVRRGAVAWVTKLTSAENGRVGNVTRGGASDPKRFPALGGLGPTAAALMVRLYAGESPARNASFAGGAKLVRQEPPRAPADGEEADFAYWYWGSLAMFQLGGADWKAWKAPVRKAILATQRREPGRDEGGSWDASGAQAVHGGRVFATALNCMTLEIEYRYERLFDR